MLRTRKETVHPTTTGFQSPAADYLEPRLDIMELIILDPENTYYQRMDSEAMTGAGILKNSLLVIDRSVSPRTGDIVSVWYRNEWLVRRFEKGNRTISLLPDNPDFKPISIDKQDELIIEGVVTWSNTCHCKRLYPKYDSTRRL